MPLTVALRLAPPTLRVTLAPASVLPLMTLPVLGIGVALALTGWLWGGLAVIALGIIVPRLIKQSAPHFLLTQALEDEALFDELLRSATLSINDSKPN